MNHELLMKRCVNLGQKALGKTYPNPNVGCLLFYDGNIISEGFTSIHGGNHAEINVINKIKDEEVLKKSTLFVTLEPCSHYGKTPPCCETIYKKKISKVVIGCKDPNILVNGNGIKYLGDNNVNVINGVLEKECKELHKRFFMFCKNKRPYIILKWAESVDKFISPNNDKKERPMWLSNKYTRQLVHKWRSQEHGILIGNNTYKADKPILNSRNWDKNNPQKILITKNKKFHEKDYVKVYGKKTLSSKEITDYLYKKNIHSVIVEGGKNTLNTFINDGLWDEARVIQNKHILKQGIESPIIEGYVKNKYKIDDDLIKIIFPN